MANSPSRKPNRYGLDPFLCVAEADANFYFGRTDVPPDDEEGKLQAQKDVAKGVNPERDRTLPWTLLMCGMWKFLYKKAEAEEKQRRFGKRARTPGRKEEFPKRIRITPERWAEAFNIVTDSHIRSDHLKKPDSVRREKLASGETVALAVKLTQAPGKGAAKTTHYLKDDLADTKLKLGRMEFHRKEMAANDKVKKYLQSMRTPAVN